MLADRRASAACERCLSPCVAYSWVIDEPRDIEFILESQEEGGFHVYAPELPGLHTQGETTDEALKNATEALELYVEGLRDEGRSFDTGVIRRRLPLPA